MRISVVLALAFVIAPAAVRAQSVAEPRTWTATPFIGLTFGTPGDLTSSIGLGGAAGYDATANLGFEAEVARAFDVAADTDLLDWPVTTFSVNGIYHFDVIHVTPYATFGLGLVRSGVSLDLDGGDDPSASRTEIAYNFGGGLKRKVGDTLMARVDLRRFQANDAAPDHWRLYGGLTFVLR